MTAMLKAAWQCVTAGLILMALSLVLGTPGWLMDAALALMAVGGWDVALGAWFVLREAWRDQEAFEAVPPWRPVRVGTCSLHGTVWSGPGYSSFRAFADHGPCAMRVLEEDGHMDRIRDLAALARQMEDEGWSPPPWAPGPLSPAMWQRVPEGRKPATEVRYHDADEHGIRRVAEVIVHVELYPGAARCICDAGAGCPWWRFASLPEAVLSTGMIMPLLQLARLMPIDPPALPGTTTVAALADGMERLGDFLAGLAGKLAPGHMPECDCSECD